MQAELRWMVQAAARVLLLLLYAAERVVTACRLLQGRLRPCPAYPRVGRAGVAFGGQGPGFFRVQGLVGFRV